MDLYIVISTLTVVFVWVTALSYIPLFIMLKRFTDGMYDLAGMIAYELIVCIGYTAFVICHYIFVIRA